MMYVDVTRWEIFIDVKSKEASEESETMKVTGDYLGMLRMCRCWLCSVAPSLFTMP